MKEKLHVFEKIIFLLLVKCCACKQESFFDGRGKIAHLSVRLRNDLHMKGVIAGNYLSSQIIQR